MKTVCVYCKKKLIRTTTRAKGRCYCNAQHQMFYEYKNGIRNRNKIIEQAHQIIREKGHYKRDNSYLTDRSPAATPEARKKIKEAKIKSNWMRGRTGSLHHNWKGGKIWWRGKEWNDIKKKIIKRDRNRCVKCGMSNKENIKRFSAPLQVDHIRPYRETKNNRPENLQTLCNVCHGKKSGIGK